MGHGRPQAWFFLQMHVGRDPRRLDGRQIGAGDLSIGILVAKVAASRRLVRVALRCVRGGRGGEWEVGSIHGPYSRSRSNVDDFLD